MKLIFTIALSLCFSAGLVAQDGATLIDEFANPNCEDLSVRLDSLLLTLSADSTKDGIIFIAGKQSNIASSLNYEALFKGYIGKRRFDTNRVKFVRTALDSAVSVQLWIAPHGTNPLASKAVRWDLRQQPGKRAFIVSSDFSPFDDICPPADDAAILIEYLEQNPQARGNIVIQKYSQFSSRKNRSTLLKRFESSGIASRRMRFFFPRPSTYSPGREPATEFWLLP